MASATRFDITAQQGSEVYLQFRLKNRDSDDVETPFDLTNKTLRGQVRATYSSTTKYDFDLTIADAENGDIVVYMGANLTETMPTGPLVYDIEVVDNTNTNSVIKPLWGNFYLKAEVTR